MPNYRVYWNETRSTIINAENEEEAIELVKQGEFEEKEVNSEGVDLSSVEIH